MLSLVARIGAGAPSSCNCLATKRELRQPQDGSQFPESVKVYGPVQTPPPQTFFDRLPRRLGIAFHYRWLQRSWRGPANSILLETYHLVEQVLTQHDIDVSIFEHLTSAYAGSLVKRHSSQTIRILDAHNVDHKLISQNNSRGTDRTLVSSSKFYSQVLWDESHLSQLVDAFFACSKHDQEVLESLNKPRIKGYVVSNGVDSETRPFDNTPNKSESKQILFCGSLDYPANRDGLLWFHQETWPLILKRQPSARLVIIGRGALRERFETLCADPTVEFGGTVDDVVPYYRRTGVVVVPLRKGSGTRLKILEAMSMGNPVVSTQIGVQGIEAVDGEHLLVADEPTQFAEAVDKLLVNAELFEKMRHAARRLVEARYDWHVIGDTMNQAIENLLNQREHASNE